MNKKRKDGRRQKSFRIDGRRYYVYGDSQRELDKKAEEKRREIEAGIDRRDNPTTREYFDSWMEASSGSLKESTIMTKKNAFTQCAEVRISTANACFGDMKLSAIRPEDIREIQANLVKKGTHSQTINLYTNILSNMFAVAIREQRLVFNPCSAVLPIKHEEERARDTIHRALKKEEIEAFFAEAERKNSCYLNLYRFALLTGMRFGEIAGLLPKDIKDGKIYIERTVTRTDGGSILGSSTKTKKGRRTIPLNDDIRAVLKEQRRINKVLFGDIVSIDEPIFRGVRGNILEISPVNQNVSRMCKGAGIEKFTMHAFRATFATKMIEQGVNIRTLQEILGHANYSLTMDLYGHVHEETKREAMEALEIGIKVG